RPLGEAGHQGQNGDDKEHGDGRRAPVRDKDDDKDGSCHDQVVGQDEHLVCDLPEGERYPLDDRMDLRDDVALEMENEWSSQVGGVELTHETRLGLVQRPVADVDRRQRRLNGEQRGQKAEDSDQRQAVAKGDPPLDPWQSRG
ncbi:MAG: hypothetical protein GY794_19585, partial [bacterium]|nr:hypothetical protein [bacterium]